MRKRLVTFCLILVYVLSLFSYSYAEESIKEEDVLINEEGENHKTNIKAAKSFRRNNRVLLQSADGNIEDMLEHREFMKISLYDNTLDSSMASMDIINMEDAIRTISFNMINNGKKFEVEGKDENLDTYVDVRTINNSIAIQFEEYDNALKETIIIKEPIDGMHLLMK